ncbi:unnamed protein product [Gongylonema pulchrum]|uniref:Uncharacterized protein n=1 Tax=Gongylonema pulchrum TaxID=637853 RepID=A0A183E166_9BILA|nr:unnamed protein product [Gongylonema pulchrum]
MAVSDFLKDLPTSDGANFTTSQKCTIAQCARIGNEKHVICDQKPILLKFLKTTWIESVCANRESSPSSHSERKRPSEACNGMAEETDEGDEARGSKTRRTE